MQLVGSSVGTLQLGQICDLVTLVIAHALANTSASQTNTYCTAFADHLHQATAPCFQSTLFNFTAAARATNYNSSMQTKSVQ